MGALSLFGKDNLGKIEEINVKGLDVQMIIVYKYDLILIAMLSYDIIVQNMSFLRSEAEKALDMFYSSYVKEIDDTEKSVDVSRFHDFKQILEMQVKDYLQLLNDKEKDKEIGDFGFFTEAIKKSRNNKEP